jgi:hypothetical protein
LLVTGDTAEMATIVAVKRGATTVRGLYPNAPKRVSGSYPQVSCTVQTALPAGAAGGTLAYTIRSGVTGLAGLVTASGTYMRAVAVRT